MNIFGNLNNLYLKANKSNKYSNDTLFGRRETEYSSKIKLTTPSSRLTSAINRPYSCTLKVSLTNKSKNKFNKKNSAFLTTSPKSAVKRLIHEENYFYKNNNKSNNKSKFKSFIEFERYYNPNKTMKKYKNRKNDGIYFNTMTNICNDNLNYINTIYLTETNIKKKPLMTRDLISNTDYDNTSTIANNNYSKHKNADILSKFMKDKITFNRNEVLKTEFKEKMIENKNRKINIKKETAKEYREKLRKEKIFKYSLKSKEELIIRTKEQYQNELGYLNDKIESFKTWKKLNQDFFTDKIDEYLKFLMYQKSYEKNKVEDLLEEIIQLKNDITKINSKMAKIELEKSKILRWIFFQIKLKEKKVVLPSYYITILENLNEINSYYEVKTRKISNSYMIKSPETHRNINNLSPSKKRDKLKKSVKRPKPSYSLDNSNPPNLKNELIMLLNKTEGKEAYLKIKGYKNHLIYNIDDFNDRISSLERENLRLIVYNTNLNYKIKEMQNQLDKVIEQNNKILDDYNYNLNVKLNELERLKINNTTMENIIKVFHSLNYYKSGNRKTGRTSILINAENNEGINPIQNISPITMININTKNKSSKNKDKSKNPNKKLSKEMLFIKVDNLFTICQSVKFNDEKHYDILKEKEKVLKNFGILYPIFYIEYCVNYLLTFAQNFENNHKDGKKKMKKILFEIEKTHREEKAEEMRKQRLQKYIKLQKDLYKRYNKVYVPMRQLNIRVKKKKKKIVVKEKKKIPSFEDFIYEDSSDEMNNIKNILEEEKHS